MVLFKPSKYKFNMDKNVTFRFYLFDTADTKFRSNYNVG